MKPSFISFGCVITGLMLVLVAFISFCIAGITGEMKAWWVAGASALVGIPLFLTGEHLRSRELNRPPTK